jgi:hypothetical protein
MERSAAPAERGALLMGFTALPDQIARVRSPIMSKIIFLIPSYQPTVVSCELLEDLRRTDPAPIVVVDDGSGPTYRELFQRAARVPGTTVLMNAINLGKGAALKHGMNHVLVHHPDCAGVVTADADGQHAVSDILKIANDLRAHPAEAIFGSRDFKRDVPLRSKIGNVQVHDARADACSFGGLALAPSYIAGMLDGRAAQRRGVNGG